MSVTTVYFNDVLLNDVVNIYNLDLNQYPDYEIRRYKIARADKSITTSKEAVSKTITLTGAVCGTNRSDVESSYAMLKLLLFGVSGTLKVEQAGEEVIYDATCDAISESWNRSVLEVEVTLVADDPFGKVQPLVSLVIPNITTSTSAFTLTGSSFTTIQPIITLTYTSVTGGTGESVSIVNSDTQQGITIDEDFATGDILFIDSENFTVTLNGAVVDFTGIFPTFPASITDDINITYTDSFSGRDVDGTFDFYTRL